MGLFGVKYTLPQQTADKKIIAGIVGDYNFPGPGFAYANAVTFTVNSGHIDNIDTALRRQKIVFNKKELAATPQGVMAKYTFEPHTFPKLRTIAEDIRQAQNFSGLNTFDALSGEEEERLSQLLGNHFIAIRSAKAGDVEGIETKAIKAIIGEMNNILSDRSLGESLDNGQQQERRL